MQRSSILCPNCRRLISADERRCPHCNIATPGSRLKNNPLTRVLSKGDMAVKAIIAVNIGMYVISLLLNPSRGWLSAHPLLFLSPGDDSLILLGATGTVPIDAYHRWWSLISANYLHGGILHIFFNMFAFRQLAPLAIEEYGSHRMFALYTIGGTLGFLISYMAGVRLTIGASAAVCSLMGALLYYGKSRGGIYGQTIYRQVGGWAVGIFIFGIMVPGINNWGHGGGVLAGGLLGFLLGYRERIREKMLHKWLSVGCMVVTGGVLCWAILSALVYRLL